MTTTWPWWTDDHLARLEALCREHGIDAPLFEIDEIAKSYMSHGADGGGNEHGLLGTAVALNVDRISRAHWQEQSR